MRLALRPARAGPVPRIGPVAFTGQAPQTPANSAASLGTVIAWVGELEEPNP